MHRARATVCLMVLVVFLSLFLAMRFAVVASPSTITVPTDFPSIQGAINNATEGDMVFVLNGTYYENVVVNKTISLMGENRSNTIIDGGGTGKVIQVEADHVSVRGFTIRNSGADPADSGVLAGDVQSTNITGNTLSDNYVGIYYSLNSRDGYAGQNVILNNTVGLSSASDGHVIEDNNITANTLSAIHLDRADTNAVRNNNITANGEYGIRLYYSVDNILEGNRVTDSEYGVSLEYSGNTTLKNNEISACAYNFQVLAVTAPSFFQDIDTSNTVDDRPIYYLVNQEDVIIGATSQAGYVAFIESTNMTVTDLDLTHNGHGILCAYTTSSTIETNVVMHNYEGISIYESDYITVSGNIVTDNSEYGISVNSGYQNTVDDNTVSRNTVGILSYSLENCTISDNRLTTNSEEGLVMLGSNSNTISGNLMESNNQEGMYMFNSDNNQIASNEFRSNLHDGLWIDTCVGNVLSGNNVSWNGEDGLYFLTSLNCVVQNNRFEANENAGVYLYTTDNTTIVGNDLSDNSLNGVRLYSSSHNRIFHNSFLNNPYHAEVFSGSNNAWDDGYPSGGNFWDNYPGEDLQRGPYQNITGSDGIGDTPVILNTHNRDRYPLMNIFRFHNIAVLNVEVDLNEVYTGWTVEINITATNTGHYVESFNVAAFYNSVQIGRSVVHDLSPGERVSVVFAWNTTGLPPCLDYSVKGEVDPVPSEADLEDNVYLAGLVRLKLVGDTNGDGAVNIIDIARIAWAFASQGGDDRYSLDRDLNRDDLINIIDISLAGINFGSQC